MKSRTRKQVAGHKKAQKYWINRARWRELVWLRSQNAKLMRTLRAVGKLRYGIVSDTMRQRIAMHSVDDIMSRPNKR